MIEGGEMLGQRAALADPFVGMLNCFEDAISSPVTGAGAQPGASSMGIFRTIKRLMQPMTRPSPLLPITGIERVRRGIRSVLPLLGGEVIQQIDCGTILLCLKRTRGTNHHYVLLNEGRGRMIWIDSDEFDRFSQAVEAMRNSLRQVNQPETVP
jgi:hypothetical protein